MNEGCSQIAIAIEEFEDFDIALGQLNRLAGRLRVHPRSAFVGVDIGLHVSC